MRAKTERQSVKNAVSLSERASKNQKAALKMGVEERAEKEYFFQNAHHRNYRA